MSFLLNGLFDELPDLKGAACTGHPYPDLFFPENRSNMAREAKALCDGVEGVSEPCPVRAACKGGARDRGEPYGVWGGETEQERAAAHVPPPKPVKAPPTKDWRCGSIPGYSRHRRAGEDQCDLCRLAWNERRSEQRKASA